MVQRVDPAESGGTFETTAHLAPRQPETPDARTDHRQKAHSAGDIAASLLPGAASLLPGPLAGPGAQRLLSPRGRAMVVGAGVGLLIAGAVAPLATLAVISLVLLLPFACISTHRALALLAVRRTPSFFRSQPLHHADADRLFEAKLPTYAVLVPLYDEADSVRGLIKSLSRLDYPTDKLDIVFITEADDVATRTAIDRQRLPPHMRVVSVPPGAPRTKPRALNHALRTARGELVVVYDAEDAPEADQLQKAVAEFARRGLKIACLQARLNVDNRSESWFSRQFAIEYTALFGGLLPVLAAWRLPIPLGGTSNHFRRDVLDQLGGWDAYNVTEDADLGIRLARAGHGVAMLDSTTWEEAPFDWATWRGQRRRWLKGWVQTGIVHFRDPGALIRDVGAGSTCGLAMLFTALIVSALVHPWVYIAAILGLLMPATGSAATTATALGPVLPWLWGMALVNLIIGYVTAIALGIVAVRRIGWADLTWTCLSMPVYWMLISYSAYAALIELCRLPHHWEKTMHRARRRSDGLGR